MRSLRQQVLVLMLASLVLLASSFILILGWHMRERAISAAIIKAQSDLATCTEITDLKYPGDWRVENGILYKGKAEISHLNSLVDSLAKLTGDTVTIFLNDTRVATTVRGTDGERAIGTKVSDVVAQKVLKNGENYLGEANVVGQIYQTAYEPLRDTQGNILGMFYVGISRSYAQEMIANSLGQTAALGAGLTLIVGLLTWLFIEKVIIRPLHNITLGTRDLATGHVTEKIDVTGPKEIGELASAFNQMIERLESVAKGFEGVNNDSPRAEAESLDLSQLKTQLQHKDEPDPELIFESERREEGASEPREETSAFETQGAFQVGTDLNIFETRKCSGEHGLPKGLNKGTLTQISRFLLNHHDFFSAEDVAEGVKLTRVTVRRYLEFLEQCGALTSELKYGTVGRPVRLWHLKMKD